MSAVSILSSFGSDLTAADHADLAKRWITSEIADQAGLRRVDSLTGQQMFGRKRGDCSGRIIPNCWPGEKHVREYRLRLDNPELEYRIDGSIREMKKYLQPPERGNILYIPPMVSLSLLGDTTTTVIITEGEFKALALARLGQFLAIAVAGVWNWRGTVGKTTGPNGARCDVKGVIPDFDRITWKDRRVVIAFDADCESNPKVRAARAALSAILIERGATVGYLEWPIEEGKGIDDRLAAVGPEKVLAGIAAVDFGGWSTRLLRNEGGKIINCYENVALFFENSPEWAGVLGYSEFTSGYVILSQPPAPITAEVGSELEDHFDTEAVRWIERKRLMVKPEMVRRVVDAVARKNTFHPIRDYLEALPKWDGIERIRTWLTKYCGVEKSDYTSQIGAKFLMSAVARILEPGCKVDHLLIMEGPQGIGKSAAVRILAGDEWFSDQLADMGSKDASMQLRGTWIVELAELDALGRSEMARAKAFLSVQTERFRLPYGRRIVQVPRQCVFVGTTNSDAWLKDETGGRRFWPVRCRGTIDLAGLSGAREQLWAEALHEYRAGTRWWLEDANVVGVATEEQRGRYIEDPWHQQVIQIANTHAISDGIAVAEVLLQLGLEVARRDQAAANRVARCLKAEGWERRQERIGDGRRWRYYPPEQSPVSPVVTT